MSNSSNDKILSEASEIYDDLHTYQQERMDLAKARGDLEEVQAITAKHYHDEAYREILAESDIY